MARAECSSKIYLTRPSGTLSLQRRGGGKKAFSFCGETRKKSLPFCKGRVPAGGRGSSPLDGAKQLLKMNEYTSVPPQIKKR